MINLPPELMQRVAYFCRLSDIQSLVSLNKHFYHSLISTLYQAVHITSMKHTMVFCCTVGSEQSSLGLYVRSLHIEVKDRHLVINKSAVQEKLRSLLLSIENVTDMTLDLCDYIIEGLFDHHSLLAIPFMLQRFSCTVTAGHGFHRLLCQQRDIKELDLLGNASQPGWSEREVASVKPDVAFPRLCSLSAGIVNILRLVPERPVSCIAIVEPPDLVHISRITSRMLQASVPLISFSVTIAVFSEWECEIHLVKWLSSLAHCHGSLENLCFRITSLDWHPLADALVEDIPVVVDPKTFNKELGRFVVLRSFTLESGHSGRPGLFEFAVPELAQLHSWRFVCPSLSFVSLFGDVLS
ncbi:hypothetical protein FS749_006744 [Ceratobasidium sp. UAMH 11750]|nr:hypothetical protein FS749_006744 [Ceratobasidium sp. UAMH 11750]